MLHYICTGSCLGEWQKPGLCDAQFCSKEGKPLLSCSCEDGLHIGAENKEKLQEDDPDNI